MSDMGDAFREYRAYQKQVRAQRLHEWKNGGYKEITGLAYVKRLHNYSDNHFGVELQDNKGIIQYWPSTCKWEYKGKVRSGTVQMFIGFISNRMKE